jgi:hypothetical protein
MDTSVVISCHYLMAIHLHHMKGEWRKKEEFRSLSATAQNRLSLLTLQGSKLGPLISPFTSKYLQSTLHDVFNLFHLGIVPSLCLLIPFLCLASRPERHFQEMCTKS